MKASFILIASIIPFGCNEDVTPYRLIVEQDTVFCRPGTIGAGFKETRRETFRAWIPAGDYDLPALDAPETMMRDDPRTEHDWRLPVSLEFETTTIEDAAFEDGALWVEMNEARSGTPDRAFFFAKQPVVLPDGRRGSFNLEQVEETIGGRSFVVGPSYDPETLGVALWWDEPPYAFMASCHFDFFFDGLRYVWRVEHELGVVELELVGGYWRWHGAPPIVFDRAAGDHAGTSFEQQNHFKLIHFPESLDAAWNSFAVLFDEPIDGACGVSFTNLGPNEEEARSSASLVDCELNEIGAIEILEATLLEPDWPS